MAKLHPATATAVSLCWNQGALLELGFFCWVHHFVLLQPLCFLLPSPFVFDEHLRFCWNWCPCLLQPAGVCATRSVPRRGSYIQQQGVLYPTLFEHRELQPATGGAVRVGGHFFADAFFAEPIFLFLLEPVYFFAGTKIIFCFFGHRALKCSCRFCWHLSLFLLQAFFDFASTNHPTSTRGDFFAERFLLPWHSNPASWRRRDDASSHPDC
ncbi:hypothetical protein VPH35_046920 [Triticum aestivum]